MNQIECDKASKVKASLDRETVLHMRGAVTADSSVDLNEKRMKAVSFVENGNSILQIYTDDGTGSGWLVAQFAVTQK